ncbi:Ectoine hydroxylase-related dioxygenase, phytanoyl-CoA dioxygenase (PhyH) family [Abditibacterium utsteinense]|uniref:Ectoine hydroxylase-related dioxygenase, phytanoyl-CoA dioxygenase (PhyH) family n=1 Tax=Abditibacterium utsteinense TaxID=1960156 RepID=A0A2S8SWX2_9BACT|nr:phytanoyl-CoA dioxygenase family protein [Abditibacterium utsteinense]PQV65290.1 Ectoine hydroxylase-related dioxygenase, phytanoyl-CoA dioxygenase (PhyH) family [Abditibacterium utsteinense]
MLNPQQIEFFQENGFLLVEGLLSPEEAAHYRLAAHDLAARIYADGQKDATWASAKSVSGQQTSLQHCHDVQFYSADFARLLMNQKFAEAAQGVMQTPNVQLHHTKMFIKPGEKGSPFPMHQDAPYFPHDNHSMIAAVFYFDDARSEKGPIRVVPGSHKLGVLPHIQEGGWHLDFEEYPLESAPEIPAKAGDVVFFSYLTIHGSSLNTSDEARTTLLVQLRDPEDNPTIKTHESPGQGWMIAGIDPTNAQLNRKKVHS